MSFRIISIACVFQCLGMLLACSGASGPGGSSGGGAALSPSTGLGPVGGGGEGSEGLGGATTVAQATGPIDAGNIAPAADPTEFKLVLVCSNSYCMNPNKQISQISEVTQEGCSHIEYVLNASISLQGYGGLNSPDWDNQTIRAINLETQESYEVVTEEIDGKHGSFNIKLIADTTPQIAFYMKKSCSGEGCLEGEWSSLGLVWDGKNCNGDFQAMPKLKVRVESESLMPFKF